MARRRKGSKRRSKRMKTVPIATSIGMIPGLMYAKRGYDAGGVTEGVRWGVDAYTGFDYKEGRFDLEKAKMGALPLGVGILASTILPKLPFIGSAPKKIPLIGKYLRW